MNWTQIKSESQLESQSEESKRSAAILEMLVSTVLQMDARMKSMEETINRLESHIIGQRKSN